MDPKEGFKVEIEKRRVLATGKDKDGDITSLCNSHKAWSPRKKAAAISDIEGGKISYFVKVGDNEVGVHVVNDAKKGKYLRTNQDSTGKDNLDNLPDC
ncbi:MAG TPA: DUF3892 domain-containing protein [Thermoanaerobaculia bacterium]|nr:DUF3892 domain-containing protein [Thermoanaerobaculia bacterium]